MLHREQVCHREPHRRTQQLRQRLWLLRVPPHFIEDVLMPLRLKLRIASNLHLFADVYRPKIFGQPFVEPPLRRGVVEIQKIMRQRMRHRLPWIRFKQIQDDIDPIRARHINPAAMLCFAGAIKPYCLSLLSATTVIGTGIFNLSFSISCPKTDRICSIRKATSRPRFSLPSVSTEKCVECTSIHLGSSLANPGCGKTRLQKSQQRDAPSGEPHDRN